MHHKKLIKLDRVLPVELRLPSVGCFLENLYLSSGEREKWRCSFYHPLVVLPTTGYFLTLYLTVILVWPEKLSHQDELLLHYLGDASVPINSRYHASAMFVTVGYTNLLFHLIHWRGTKKQVSSLQWHITRQKIAPILLLLGHCTPLEIGLRSRARCILLVHKAHFYARWIPIVNKVTDVFLVMGSSLILFGRAIEDGFGTPLAFAIIPIYVVFYTIYVGYFYAVVTYHMFYLSLLTTYFRLKLEQLIEDLKLRGLPNSWRMIWHTTNITRDVHHIQWEVHCYNRHFWSRVIFAFISCFVANGTFFLYTCLFANLNVAIRMCGLIALTVGTASFALLLYSVSWINQLGMMVYRGFHSYHTRNYALSVNVRFGVRKHRKCSTKLKVMTFS